MQSGFFLFWISDIFSLCSAVCLIPKFHISQRDNAIVQLDIDSVGAFIAFAVTKITISSSYNTGQFQEVAYI